MLTLALAFVAGLLSTLSPCVLPLLPLVLGAAASEHRLGPLALAGGLALSFVAFGMFIATIGYSIGLNGDVLRSAAAVVMILIGLVLVVPGFQARLAMAGGPVADWAENRFGGASRAGLSGQFGVGLLLGAVWSPCVGPTLGAASILAAEGKNLGEVAATMLVFGLGAALPLVVLGALSREMMMRLRGRLMSAGKGAKMALGVLLVLIGASILTHWDRQAQGYLLQHMPAWLDELTTRY